MSKTLSVPSVKPDAIITIEVSGYFLKQLQMTLIAMGEQRTPEEFKAVLEKLKANEPADDLYEIQVHLILSLVATLEKNAMAQDKVTYTDMPIPD